MNILRFLQEVDRRFLYGLILLASTVPFFLKVRIPVTIQPATQKFYDAVEALHENDFVILGVDWGGGTRGENRAQTIAIINHLMRKKCRFALLSFEPQSKTLCQTIAEQETAKYHYVEGVNWVNFGYKPDQENYLKGFVLNIPQQVGIDRRGIPLSTLPVMQGITTAADVKLLADVTPSDTYNGYIKFMTQSYKIPLCVAPTSVMAPEAFNRLDSGQVVGLMSGLQGAVEYEQLLGLPGKATSASLSSSAAHLLIIGFILLGNLAMILERRQRALAGGH